MKRFIDPSERASFYDPSYYEPICDYSNESEETLHEVKDIFEDMANCLEHGDLALAGSLCQKMAALLDVPFDEAKFKREVRKDLPDKSLNTN